MFDPLYKFSLTFTPASTARNMAMLLPDDRLARVEEQVEQLLKVNQAMADLIASLVSHHLRGQHSHHLAPGTPWSPAPSEVEEEGTGPQISLC